MAKFLAVIAELIASPGAPELFGTGFGQALSYLGASGFKVHLLLDEFDQTVRNTNLGDPFYDALRSLPIRAENVSYVIATRTGLAALQSDYNKVSSPFFNIFTRVTLDPFQEDEAHLLIFDYFSRAELDISLADRLCTESLFLYDVTGFHPFFLQTLCYHLCASLDKPGWPLGQAGQEALRAFEKDSEKHFQFYWKLSSIEEQGSIEKLAARQSIDWNDLGPVAENLKDRCLIVPSESGWRLFSSAFSRWIKEQKLKLERLLGRASEHEAAGDWEKAISAYREALDIDADNREVTNRLARAHRCSAEGYRGALYRSAVKARYWWNERDLRAKAFWIVLLWVAIFGLCIGGASITRGMWLLSTLTPTYSPIAFHTPTLTPTETLSPTPVPTDTPTPTPTLTPLPPVTLEEPEDGLCFGCRSEVVLRWNCRRDLQAGEFSRLRLRSKGQDSFTYHKEDYYSLIDLPPGEYSWAVALVRAAAQGEYVLLSAESTWYSFEVLPPPPVVHTISPMSTVRGIGVTVLVSGENFTRSLALTIGVPLKVTFVNSSTITATVPTTLEVGEYPVIVKDSVGQGESYASFAVGEPPTPTPVPVPSPWNPATPIPTAPPDYNPYMACVVKPCAPAPQLIEPEDGAEVRFSSTIQLRWTWDYCLPPEWKFAVRISDVYPPHTYRHEDNPLLISCQDGKTIGRYPVGKEFSTRPGTYYWNMAVVRGVEGGWERLSENSRTCIFVVLTPPPSHEGPDRPD